MDLEDFLSIFLKRQINKQPARKTPQRGLVEIKGPIGSDHDKGRHVIHTVPLSKELIDEFAMASAVAGAAAGAEDGVGLIDKDDARCQLFCEAEDGFDVFFAFADVHVVDICGD